MKIIEEEAVGGKRREQREESGEIHVLNAVFAGNYAPVIPAPEGDGNDGCVVTFAVAFRHQPNLGC